MSTVDFFLNNIFATHPDLVKCHTICLQKKTLAIAGEFLQRY